jgi:cyclopropane fatty-acyl-phospholipid synthase-like methyltransferase
MSVDLPDPEEVGLFYDRYTRLFEILWGDSLHFGYWPSGSTAGSIEEGQDRFTDLLASKMGDKSGRRLLDVGCGTGRATLSLAQKTKSHLTGINISARQVEAAKSRAIKMGLGEQATFEVADALAIPFADGSFDGAWAVESLLHMPDLARAASELRRVVKAGSRIVVSDVVLVNRPSVDDDQYYRGVFPVAPAIPQGDYVRILEAADFEVDDVLDVTPHVERTLSLTLENIDKRAGDIREVYGPDFAAMLKDSWGKGIGIHLASFGYSVFAGRAA